MNKEGTLFVYRGCTPVVDVEYDTDGDGTATEAIVGALADAVGVAPTALPPLYEYVDPDALEALFERSGSAIGSTLLGFQVDTWNVFVRSDGRISVCDATQQTDPEPVFASTTS